MNELILNGEVVGCSNGCDPRRIVGHEHRRGDDPSLFRIQCHQCGADTPKVGSPEEARRVWNLANSGMHS